MKKIFGIIIFAAALCACNAEFEDKLPEDTVLRAILSDEPATKTYLDQQHHNRWNAGDFISAFVGTTANQKYAFQGDTGDNAGDFEKYQSGSSSGQSLDAVYAVYPYSASNTISRNGEISVSLPSVQQYAEDSFGPGANTMAAVSSGANDNFLNFKNVCGYLVINVYGNATVTSVTLNGNNGERISGSATITPSYSGAPMVSMAGNADTSITLDCGNGVTLGKSSAGATAFWFALPPTSFSNGFSVTINTTDGKSMTKSTSKAVQVDRNKYYTLTAFEYAGESEDPSSKPFTITSTGSTSVSIAKSGSPDAITLEYRVGSDAWAPYTIGAAVSLSDDQYVQFRAGDGGNASFSTYYDEYYHIATTGSGSIKASGNIMSLLDNTMQLKTIPCNYCFYSLFEHCYSLIDAASLLLPASTLTKYCYSGMFSCCTSLTIAPELPAMTLANFCYEYMFSYCSSLTTTPKLPAATLTHYCYYGMFSGCTTLITTPKLPATNLADDCYGNMFNGCTSLTTAPDLPATSLASHCYYGMFRDCTSLTTAPDLPATSLADGCYYNMFYGCISLQKAPQVLPATILASSCYRNMFRDCRSLTTAPDLPATALISLCYECMFCDCRNLSYVKMLATDISSHWECSLWLSGVKQTGTFVKSKDATWDNYGVVPEGWTVQYDDSDQKTLSFIATHIPDTKSTMEDLTLSYSPGDKLSLFSLRNNNVMLTTTDEGVEATFTGTGYEDNKYYSVYPYSPNLYRKGDIIYGLDIPSFQKAIPNSFDPSYLIEFASSTDNHLYFDKLICLFKVTIGDWEDVNKISLEFASGSPTGTARIDKIDYSPTLIIVKGNNSVSVGTDSGKTLPAGTYYLVTAPGDYSGLTLRLTSTAGDVVCEKTLSGSVSLQAKQTCVLGDTISPDTE